MKRIISFSIVLFVFFSDTKINAQALDKGSWLVGGSLGFRSVSGSGVSTSSFYLNPNVGHFFANRLAAGMAFAYENSSTTVLGVGPFMRGYLKMGSAYLFGHLRFEYGNVSSAVFSGDRFGMGAGPALGVFLNDHVGLEGILDYQIPDFSADGHSLSFNIGLQVYFPKK